MDWVNYHHLLYFWVVAKEGSLAGASEELRLAQSTVSKQIHALEGVLGHALFAKSGRRLVLTESGRVAFRYAEEIFSLGREMLDTLKDRPVGRPLRVTVGVADVVPKLLAQRVLAPALNLVGVPVRLVCHEDKPDRLLADLALHELDVVLTDAAASPHVKVRAFSHLLGESGVTFYGTPELATRHRDFPKSLDRAPVLLPTENTALRRSLDQWFESLGLRPNVVGEFEDSALLNVFGSRGAGLFPAPTVTGDEVQRQFQVRPLGVVPDVRERLYALTVERRIKHPAVMAICDTARNVFQEKR